MPCTLACQTKIILNSGNIVGVSTANNSAIRRMKPEHFDSLDGNEVIKLLNRMEDDAVKVQKLLIKGVGYDGEVGKMLSD